MMAMPSLARAHAAWLLALAISAPKKLAAVTASMARTQKAAQWAACLIFLRVLSFNLVLLAALATCLLPCFRRAAQSASVRVM